VPRALVALPHVESSFNPRAYSRVGAAGIWQFTRSTGRRYLRVDHVVDERMDPFEATVAAARLLRDNHRRLETWPLAITAYNHGVAGIARAVRKTGTTDIATIAHEYEGRTFGFASRNFYAEFLAAWQIHQAPERYFGALPSESPLVYAILETDAYYPARSLARALGIDRETLRSHNLALRPSVWNGAKLVPKDYALRIPIADLDGPVDAVLAQIPDSERLSRQKRDRFHKVRRGESLSLIARRYGVTQRELVALNNLRSRHRIRAGQVLRLPHDGSAPILVTRAEPPADGVYHVRRGDNLSIVAARFGVTQQDLVRWNRLRNRNHLTIGQRLRVSGPTTVVARADQATASDARVVNSAPPPASPPPVASDSASAAETLAVPAPLPEASIADVEPETSVIAVIEPSDVGVPDPSNYAVTSTGRVTVQAEETLGHYADWLEVSASRLRGLNGMGYATPLVIGRQKKLDFSRVTPEVFEQRRLEYHRTLQEEFFDAWRVTGTTTHVIRRGDSLWYLANRKFEVPIWLLRQHNPELDFGALPAGTPLVIPILEPRGSET
jgi:membrane-bound lytic murein transglycosylase D